LKEGPIVCDAGPLIGLASVAQLELLPSLYRRILVPEQVLAEVMQSGAGRVGAIEIGSADWLEVVPSQGQPDALLTAELGIGESAVLSVAVQLRAPLVLIDERRARRIAAQIYSLAVRGTAGILVEGKRAGFVPEIRPLLDGMVRRGYYLSTRLIEFACQAVGE
jgi:predicted nucleic acid-binding protein